MSLGQLPHSLQSQSWRNPGFQWGTRVLEMLQEVELFHTYYFSLYTGADGVWEHWCAFTLAMNAMGLLKASVMSLWQFPQKVSPLLSRAVGSGWSQKHMSSHKSAGPLSALRLDIPTDLISMAGAETPACILQIPRAAWPNSFTPPWFKVHIFHNVLILFCPIFNSNLTKNATEHSSWFFTVRNSKSVVLPQRSETDDASVGTDVHPDLRFLEKR